MLTKFNQWAIAQKSDKQLTLRSIQKSVTWQTKKDGGCIIFRSLVRSVGRRSIGGGFITAASVHKSVVRLGCSCSTRCRRDCRRRVFRTDSNGRRSALFDRIPVCRRVERLDGPVLRRLASSVSSSWPAREWLWRLRTSLVRSYLDMNHTSVKFTQTAVNELVFPVANK